MSVHLLLCCWGRPVTLFLIHGQQVSIYLLYVCVWSMNDSNHLWSSASIVQSHLFHLFSVFYFLVLFSAVLSEALFLKKQLAVNFLFKTGRLPLIGWNFKDFTLSVCSNGPQKAEELGGCWTLSPFFVCVFVFKFIGL